MGKFAFELAFVDLALAFVFFVFDDQDGAVVAEEFDDFEPVVEVGVLFAIVGE